MGDKVFVASRIAYQFNDTPTVRNILLENFGNVYKTLITAIKDQAGPTK
jgi:hypothetical protein